MRCSPSMAARRASSSRSTTRIRPRRIARRIGRGRIERIGQPDARMSAKAAGGPGSSAPGMSPRRISVPRRRLLIDWLERHLRPRHDRRRSGFASCTADRVTMSPERVTPALIAELRRIIPLDEDHLPGQIALIERFQERCRAFPPSRASTPASTMKCRESPRSCRFRASMRPPESGGTGFTACRTRS